MVRRFLIVSTYRSRLHLALANAAWLGSWLYLRLMLHGVALAPGLGNVRLAAAMAVANV